MKIQIENDIYFSKYNTGDIVYTYMRIHDFINCKLVYHIDPNPFIISKIHIICDDHNKITFYYDLNTEEENSKFGIEEDLCFDNLEDVQIECDSKNVLEALMEGKII